MKIIIMFLMIVLSIGLVGAIEEGQILSQSQLDDFNVNNLDHVILQCQPEGIDFWIPNIRVKYSCLNLIDYGENEYLVYREGYDLEKNAISVGRCIIANGTSYCQAQYEEEFTSQWQEQLQSIKDWIMIRQTQIMDYVNWMIDWATGWTPWG